MDIPLGSSEKFIKTDAALTCAIYCNQPGLALLGSFQYFVYIYFFPTAAIFVLFYLFNISFFVYWCRFLLCLCFCSGLVIDTCAVKPALWLKRIELDSNGSCLFWEYFGLLVYLWAGCGNFILILVVNIVTCLLLKGHTFISAEHETKLWRRASTRPTAARKVNYLMLW
jgi:hypothetical protein